jgi:glycosyltransferase involved in cell wall biosynthesis
VTIWFDVTTLFRWKRPPVGIVRVEAECFKHFAAHGENVRFCFFDDAAQAHIEVGPQAVFEVIARANAPQPNAPRASETEQLTTAKRVTQRAARSLDRLPAQLKAPLETITRRNTPIVRTALHHLRRARTTLQALGAQIEELGGKEKSIARPPESEQANFQPNDVLVSVGLAWDHQDSAVLYRLKRARGLKLLAFCYDLIPVLFPHLAAPGIAEVFARYTSDMAWWADEILCISNATQRDLQTFLESTGTPVPSTRVVHLGSDLATAGTASEGLTLPDRFLLYVSTIERRKNHEVIYRAVLRLLEQGRRDVPHVVFVGMEGWGVADLLNDLRTDPRVEGRFTILNRVTDADLSTLYSRAVFTLYPSLYEGWGLPLAESLTRGKFCLSSNRASLPEVGGEFVDYLEPWDVAQWAERIAFYVDHPAQLAARTLHIEKHYRPHTWSQTGADVLAAALALAEAPLTNADRDERVQRPSSVNSGTAHGRHEPPRADPTV